MKSGKNTIFKQFIITFLLIVLPILICGCVLIIWQKNKIESEIEKNAQADVYYGMKRFEAEIESIKMLQYYLQNDDDLKKFVLQHEWMSSGEYYSIISDIRDRIDIFMESNECIENVDIFFPKIGIMISKKNGLDDIAMDEYEALYQKVNDSKYPLRIEKEEIFSTILSSYARIDGRTYVITDVNLSKDVIFDGVLSQNLEATTNVLLYDYERETLLYLESEMEEAFVQTIESYVNKDKKDKTQTFRYNGEEYLLVSRYSEYLNQAVYQCSLKDDFLWEEKTGYLALIIYVLFSGILAFTYPRTVKKIVTIPIYRLIDAFQGLANDKLEEQITYKASDEFNYLYDEFNRMVVRLKKLIDENYKSKLLVQEAELKQMQAQINPHFMYNTYFILHRMILDEDIEEAARLSEYLGIYMEYITHNSESEVLLTRELEHTKSYLEIQQIRFGGRMRLHIEEVPEEYQKLRVPRLILQPVVENYLKYGYEISEAQGELYVRFKKEEKGISILIGGGCVAITSETIRDLQKRLNEQESGTQITGLINIHKRLKIYFGADSGVCLHREDDGRLITQLVLHYKAEVENV